MGGNDKLGIFLFQPADMTQKLQKLCRRQCRLRFVQYVQTVSSKAVFDQCHKALTVGLPVKGYTAVAFDHPWSRCIDPIHLVDIAGNIIKALRPEKESVSADPCAFLNPKIPVQLRMGVFRSKIEVHRTALGIKALVHRDGFNEGGFADTVLSHKERHRPCDLQPVHSLQALDHRQIMQITSLRQWPVYAYGLHKQVPVHMLTPVFCSKNGPPFLPPNIISISQTECKVNSLLRCNGFFSLFHNFDPRFLCIIPSCKTEKSALLYRHKEVIPMI